MEAAGHDWSDEGMPGLIAPNLTPDRETGIQPVTAPVPPPDLSTPVARGRYLVTLGSCTDCHTTMDERGQPIPGMEFAGGNVYPSPQGVIASANITQAPSGIPYYTDDLFLQVMRTGALPGRKLSDVMPWAYYRKLTDDDLKAVFAYVKTFRPVRHRVDNTTPPTLCPVCKQKHGLGDQNSAS